MWMIEDKDWNQLKAQFQSAEPFDHIVIDNFWKPEVAEQIYTEFLDYDSDQWNGVYRNALEDKKTCNSWDKFPAMTYRAFDFLMYGFVPAIQQLTGIADLRGDTGLHGGGWHAHSKGGKNNIHLDYDIHPKMLLQRKINIIVYMTPEWDPTWNGGLELWSHNAETSGPLECVKSVENKFNRAVIFDTTQNSWHGLPKELNCPAGVVRRSMAAYYLTTPATNATERKKALFAPYGAQANDPEVLELIKKRVSMSQAPTVYRK
jgi:Rps23 Pro-64 3,4-dihydroxylase Tpa1-like proline 4-hydroxylase